MNELDSSGAAGAARTGRARGRSWRGRVLATICALGLACAVPTAAVAAEGDSVAREAGLGLGAVLLSLVYGPAKVLYAVGGATTGGLAFLFSGGDPDVAKVILTPSVRGDYVVTPAHLTGERDLEFLGRDPAYRTEAPAVATAPEAAW